MRINKLILPLLALAAFLWPASAQVLSPEEITDPVLKSLQQKYSRELHQISAAVGAREFPYHFYFSRKLDLTEREQERSDQRSIQFDRFRGQLVLKITGNYFAAYSAVRMTKEERARQTINQVMLPILEAAAPALARTEVPDAFALEISHHAIRKVLGVDTEVPENVVLILPKTSAMRLIEAHGEAGRIAALDDGATYLNGATISFGPGELKKETPALIAALSPHVVPVLSAVPHETPPVAASPALPPVALEQTYREILARIVKDLDSQAHFVGYAPPSFMPFRGGQYLQIPVVTTLSASDCGSQYKLAALAFDRHIAHLIRPVLGYLKEDGVAGINFSTVVHVGDAKDKGGESVEFLFPLSALRRYTQYDLTGQQLLESGIVLINGERAGVDLQAAEASACSRN